jgi:serine/threonine protein kinase
MAKVADFGLAKSFEAAGLSDMTTAGQLCGTPLYWPREQITHYRYLAPPSDVFSIAAVFYEMLTGVWARGGFKEMMDRCQRRHRGPGMAEIMCVIVENQIAPLRERNPAIPKRVAEVIDRALREAEVPPDENKMRAALAKLRYPDAGAFRETLGKALGQSGISL